MNLFTITLLLKMISYSHVLYAARRTIAILNDDNRSKADEDAIAQIPEKVYSKDFRYVAA